MNVGAGQGSLLVDVLEQARLSIASYVSNFFFRANKEQNKIRALS